MKASKFVKKFGWEEAKFIAEYCNEKVTKVYNLCGGLYSDESVSVDDIKRLVESYELVEEFGGVYFLKIYLENNLEVKEFYIDSCCKTFTRDRLQQAITDMGSC